MKTQRMKTKQSFRLSAIASMLVMIVLLIGCFALTAAADTVAVTVNFEDLDFSDSNVTFDKNGMLAKEYDGSADVTGVLTAEGTVPNDVAAGDKVTVSVSEAYFADSKGAKTANVDAATTVVIKFKLAGEDAASYTVEDIVLPAKITPKKLQWKDNGTGSATAPFNPDSTTYADLPVTLPELVDAQGNKVDLALAETKITVQSQNCEDVTKQIAVNLKTDAAVNASNYSIAPLTVKVDITPLKITSIKLSGTSFTYGSDEANSIVATMTAVNGHECDLLIVYPTGYGEVGVHKITVKTDNMGFVIDTQYEFQVEILPVSYQVDMDSMTVVDSGAGEYRLSVKSLLGEIPQDVLEAITYTYTKDGVTTDKAVECGSYTVTANLADAKNYSFTDASGAKITSLTRTLTVNQKSIPVGPTGASYRVIITGANGVNAGLQASTALLTDLDRKAIRGFKEYRAYTLTVAGATEAYTLLLEIEEGLYGSNFKPFSTDNLYIYDTASQTMTKVTESTGFTVTLKDGCYQIEGLNADGAYTFVIAPEYDAPFWVSAPGIALIVLLILALLVLMFFIGLYLHRAQAEKNEVLVIDTEGESKPIEEAVVEEKKLDVEKVLEENAEEMEEALEKAVKAEEENNEIDVTEETEEAVAEFKEELVQEASEEEVAEEEPAIEEEAEVEAEDVTEAVAEEVAQELQETTEAEEEPLPEPEEELVREAVAEAMAENFNESADSADAIVIAPVVEDEAEDELTPENLRKAVDTIVDDAMHATMLLPVVEETEEDAQDESADAEKAEDAEEPAVCAMIADSVEIAFNKYTVDGVVPEALEGTTADIINASVMVAAKNHLPESWGEELSDTVISGVTEELVARLIKEEPETVEEPAVEEVAEEAAQESAAEEAVQEPVAEEPKEEPKDEPAVQTMAAADDNATNDGAEDDSDDDDDDDDDDNDNDNDENGDDGDSSFGFGGMSLDYIDIAKKKEEYDALLAQESNGEVRLVTRYRRSFKSRLIQSQGNVQNYYSLLKNELLAHKGVKDRMSWNYEAFNKGRAHLAKMNAKTKTLYLYLALDPEELKDTKYGIIDVSSKKKYATVPVLMKIKGDRKFKYAMELIDKLCQEKMELTKMDVPEKDYRLDYKSTEELVAEGHVKKMVAGVPVSYFESEKNENRVAEAAPVEAQADVTFVAPADDVAVMAAAEELKNSNTEAPEKTENNKTRA